MRDTSDLADMSGPEDGAESRGGLVPATAEAATGHPDTEAVSTVIAEMLPGVALVFGEVPTELELDLIDLGLVSSADRTQLSSVLGVVGNTATVAGNAGSALASVQGLYRVNDATRAMLEAGAKLAVKDGANLGTMVTSNGLAQARFIPVTGLTAAQTAAAVGPAVATIALQMQLSEITSLVKSNYALTGHVLASIQRGQRAELAGLVEAIELAVVRAKELECVPASLWEDVAGKGSDLRAARNLYRENVREHIAQLRTIEGRARRDYLHAQAEAITFDATALLLSLKAWTGYQALQAGKARTVGRNDPHETKLVDLIARDTRTELSSALDETRGLVDALTRELRLVAELPGRQSLSQRLPGARGDLKVARQTTARLLEGITPLAEALHPQPKPLATPAVLCTDPSVDVASYLRVLRWFLDDDEEVRVLALPDRTSATGAISAAVGGAMDRLSAARDKPIAKTLVVVTDRRVLTADSLDFLEQGDVNVDVPIDRVRYVRSLPPSYAGEPAVVDLITRDDDHRWTFPASVASAKVNELAAVLGEAMNLPDEERAALQGVGRSKAAINEYNDVVDEPFESADQPRAAEGVSS
ncbi:MAG: hypothetical protein U0Q10_09915 [Dermatophilaceae bacterium]